MLVRSPWIVSLTPLKDDGVPGNMQYKLITLHKTQGANYAHSITACIQDNTERITLTSHHHNGVLNHRQLKCLNNSFFKLTRRKNIKVPHTDLCEGRASNAEGVVMGLRPSIEPAVFIHWFDAYVGLQGHGANDSSVNVKKASRITTTTLLAG